MYDAFARKDIDAVFDALSADVEIYQSELVPWGGNYRGHDGAQEFFGRLLGNIESAVTADEMIEAGDHVIQIGHSRGHVKATGVRFDVRDVHVWTLRDGKVVRFEAYLDTPAMLAVLG
ncbi:MULTISPECIES: nuclear transport factor 2 family protein [Streptomyces]|uniref:nuclear transport factor 2 family protein n=1 Tax=Streptomyces TaxID=1883 RepID=UPI0002EC9919|nr:nuclear transport factor 2 family protein [Streptomyces chartreusis]MYS92942.1 hypothetical protein [Streptomyces sp. SID5464]